MRVGRLFDGDDRLRRGHFKRLEESGDKGLHLLGRTGMNLRHVLDYAKAQRCVLLIDELDSIGKRRNDDSDVGELKRLVNVLLQQIDDWPSDGSLLLGATNHPGLSPPQR